MTEDFDPRMLYAIRVTVDNAVSGLPLPENPKDGDCLDWAPRLTAVLTDAGLPANTITVIGWIQHASNLLGWIHKATLIDGGVVVDGTARQLSRNFPRLWVTTPQNYAEKLGRITGVETVTIQLDERVDGEGP